VTPTRLRLAAIDLDGTLLRADRTVSERTREALAAAAASGVTVAIASARSPRSVREIAADLELGGLAICANGATLYDLDADRILEHRTLGVESVRALVEGLRERVPGVVFGWELELRFGSEPAYEALRSPEWPRPDGSFDPCDALAFGRPLTKLLARHAEAPLEELYEHALVLAGAAASVTLAGTAFVELAAPGVSKGVALAGLARRLGVAPSEVVAFGDQPTDVPMLAWAGTGIAVANAHPAALEAADEVTSSNEEDGVALVLERLLGRAGEASAGPRPGGRRLG
jgi:Cof subfamily protein (haloacid dehalogenase superfamily)